MPDLVGPDGAILHQSTLQKVYTDIMLLLRKEMDVKDTENKPKFADVCEFMAAELATSVQRNAFEHQLDMLEDRCRSILGMPAATYQTLHPRDVDVKSYRKMNFRLWQMGGHAAYHVKGGPALHAVRDNIQKMIMGHGSETEKYPLEVLFKWPGPCHDASAMCPGSGQHDHNPAPGAASLGIVGLAGPEMSVPLAGNRGSVTNSFKQ